MERNVLLYERITEKIYNSVNEISVDDMTGMRNILIIGTNANERQNTLVKKLREKFAESKIWLVAQNEMISRLKKESQDYYTKIIKWEGTYTTELYEKVTNESQDIFDAIFFYSVSPIDKRNTNLTNIGRTFSQRGTKVYCFDAQDNISIFNDIKAYLMCMNAYDAINDFLEVEG